MKFHMPIDPPSKEDKVKLYIKPHRSFEWWETARQVCNNEDMNDEISQMPYEDEYSQLDTCDYGLFCLYLLSLIKHNIDKLDFLCPKYDEVIKHYGVDPRNILTMTFSKASVRDMKERFLVHFDSNSDKVFLTSSFNVHVSLDKGKNKEGA